MVKKDSFDPKEPFENQEDEEGGSLGGSQGSIEFRYVDPLSGPQRDDLLPSNEIHRLQIVHKDVHKERVRKQKMLREERAAVKDGRYVASMEAKVVQGKSLGGGSIGSSKHKKHWISDKAQFSGIDKQVVGIPSLAKMETNMENQEKLENRYQNRYQNTPKFNPRPKFPG